MRGVSYYANATSNISRIVFHGDRAHSHTLPVDSSQCLSRCLSGGHERTGLACRQESLGHGEKKHVIGKNRCHKEVKTNKPYNKGTVHSGKVRENLYHTDFMIL